MNDDFDDFDDLTAEEAKAEGMEAAGRGAPDAEEWRDRLLEVVHAICLDQPTLTSDDVYDRVAGELDHKHTLLPLGSVMRKAAKAGWCRKASVIPVNSFRVSRHAAPLAVWESLITDWWLA